MPRAGGRGSIFLGWLSCPTCTSTHTRPGLALHAASPAHSPCQRPRPRVLPRVWGRRAFPAAGALEVAVAVGQRRLPAHLVAGLSLASSFHLPTGSFFSAETSCWLSFSFFTSSAVQKIGT